MTPSDRSIAAALEHMRANPKNVRYSDMHGLCLQVRQVLSAIERLREGK